MASTFKPKGNNTEIKCHPQFSHICHEMSLILYSSHPITEHNQPQHLSLTLKQAEPSSGAVGSHHMA